MEQKVVLVVDDEVKIVNIIRAFLEKEDYFVIAAYDGKEALNIAQKNEIDLIILDLMLPEMTGEEVCKKVRQISDVPIIMLTAKDAEEERVKGLGIGADDYVVKPFSATELVARVKAILRRAEGNDRQLKDILTFDNDKLSINTIAHRVSYDDKVITLTPKEYKILAIMATHPERVYSREKLTEIIHGYDYEGFDRTIDAHIKNLRHKLSQAGAPPVLQTVYGTGYKFAGVK